MKHCMNRRWCERIAWLGLACLIGLGSTAWARPGLSPDDERFLDQMQSGAFAYFWYECGTNGLIQDRMSDKMLSSTMAAGFQLTALCVGAERGWATREDVAARVLTILNTYRGLPRFHGMFAHYYHIETGEVVPLMHERDDGADVSETGFMMAGVLTARAYFDKDNPTEEAIRKLATELYEAVEWNWMLKDAEGRTHRTLAWHWSPKHGFGIGQRVKSNMELSSLITYLLAIGSPTHPIPADCWNEGWAANYPWLTHEGQRFIACPPLFAHQYAQAWIDFRNMKDRHADYFRNSVLATLANREYGLKTLYPGHRMWGLTYCDGPTGYGIYGYPPKRGEIDRDAVIPPTAAAGSIVFTPRESLESLRYMNELLGERLWGKYGMYDAFSLKHDWLFEDYVAIDQGPIVMMIENLRSGLVWDLFMRNDEIRSALRRTGFVGVIDDFEDAALLAPYNLWESSAGYSHRLTRDAREGAQGLEVTCHRGGDAPGSLTAHPAIGNFSSFRYLSLWLKGLQALNVELEDDAGTRVKLEEAGVLRQDDGWAHVYCELPRAPGFHLDQIRRIHFAAPANGPKAPGEFLLDGVFLADKLDIEPPARVWDISVIPTRMPGEILLAWAPTGDDGDKGTPYCYRARTYSRPMRDRESFDRAVSLLPGADPYIRGSETNLHVTGLRPGETYYFAMTAEDLAGNRSELSAPVSMILPGTTVPDTFALDDFDDEAGTVAWSASSPAVTVSVDSDRAIQGTRSLRIDYDKKGEAERWAYVTADLDIRDLSQHRYLAMWVSGQADVLAKLVVNDDLQEDVETIKVSSADGWSPLFFDLSRIQKINRRAVSRVLLFIEPDKTDCSGSVNIDSVRLTQQRD